MRMRGEGRRGLLARSVEGTDHQQVFRAICTAKRNEASGRMVADASRFTTPHLVKFILL